jgi:hypothetical protein
MQLGDLMIEVACHEALSRQLHAVHLRLGAASAVNTIAARHGAATRRARASRAPGWRTLLMSFSSA